MSREQLDALGNFLVRVGIPTVFAAILLWFVLVKLDRVLVKALGVQARIAATVQRCCRPGE